MLEKPELDLRGGGEGLLSLDPGILVPLGQLLALESEPL